jgi:hypothetical protein
VLLVAAADLPLGLGRKSCSYCMVCGRAERGLGCGCGTRTDIQSGWFNRSLEAKDAADKTGSVLRRSFRSLLPNYRPILQTLLDSGESYCTDREALPSSASGPINLPIDAKHSDLTVEFHWITAIHWIQPATKVVN